VLNNQKAWPFNGEETAGFIFGIAVVAVLIWAVCFAGPAESKQFKDSISSTAIASAIPAVSTAPAMVCESDQKPQKRPTFVRVDVPKGFIETEDGDTVTINWPDGDKEKVRFFGADTAEVMHPEMGWDEDQPYGPDGRGFIIGVLVLADSVQLARGACLDRYNRTLAYLFVNGRNYSAMVVAARLAYPTILTYGPQGFPTEADEVTKASVEALKAGPLPFENPHLFRAKTRAKVEARKKAEQPASEPNAP